MTAGRVAFAAVVIAYALLAAAALYHLIPTWLVALLTGALTIPAIVELRRRARLLERRRAVAEAEQRAELRT